MSVIDKVMVGESLVGEGNEIAHIDLILGPRGSAVEEAFTNALANNKMGFTTLLALLEPNLQCRPNTIIFNKVTIKDTHQAVQMFGPAQFAVARAIQDSVADGIIPRHLAEDLYVCVGVFIHWDATDDAKIQEFNYQATREALWRAVKGAPTAREATEYRDQVEHPFSAQTPRPIEQSPAATEPGHLQQSQAPITQPPATQQTHDTLKPSVTATMSPHAALKPDVEHTMAHPQPAARDRWTSREADDEVLRTALVPSVTATLPSGAATRIEPSAYSTGSDVAQRAAALAAEIARAEAAREQERLREVRVLEEAERARALEAERAAAATAAREAAIRAEERRRAELETAQAAERQRAEAAEAQRIEEQRRAELAAQARAEEQRRAAIAAEGEARAIAAARAAEEERARQEAARRAAIASEAEARAVAAERSAARYQDAVVESRGFAGPSAMPPAMPLPSGGPPIQPIEVVQGLLVHKIPTEMKTETTEHVEVRIGGKDVEGLMRDLIGRGALSVNNLPIVETMTVALDGPAGAFDIVPRSQATQFVQPNTSVLEAFGGNPFASWEWDVTPRTAGNHQLRVRVSATVHDSRNTATTIALPDRVFPIDVRVDYGRSAGRFLLRALVWAALTIGAALLGIYTQEIWWPELQEVLGLRP